MLYKILSWNVNGIRAVEKKGFIKWFKKENPYLLLLQETKADLSQVGESLQKPKGYLTFWNAAEKKGYSGVACYCQEKPQDIQYGLDNKRFDSEGRTIILEYSHFILFNIYFPNGKMGPERLQFKLDFYEHFYDFLQNINKKKTKIICGDFNTAHREIDLARPKENSIISGFLPEERFWIDKLLDSGFVDTFRIKHPEGGHYTWWDFKSRARERNVGWRIDYFLMDQNSRTHLEDAFILKDVYGSDHCPIGIKLRF